MSRTVKITFVGPVERVSNPWAWQKTQPIFKGAFFTVLQDGGSLKLEYTSTTEAYAARRQLCMTPHTHQVGSTQLLTAIHQALIEAKAGNPQGTVSDNPETQDQTLVEEEDVDAL